MPILEVYVSDDTLKRLQSYSAVFGDKVEDLASAAIEEAAAQAVPKTNGIPQNPYVAEVFKKL